MSQLFYGSINYDSLLRELKSGKIKTFKSDAGIRLINVNVWVNDEPDQFDNDATIQLQLKDEFRDEKKPYIGNLKKYVKKEPTAVDSASFAEQDEDLQF